MSQTLYPYYTYMLSNPFTGLPFYIGKGKGNRIDHHELETRRGVSSYKCNTIRMITENNGTIIKTKIAYFQLEQDAYDHETDLINEIGLGNLTNIMPGGQRAFTRRVNALSARRQLSAVDLVIAHVKHFSNWATLTKIGRYKIRVPSGGMRGMVMEAWYNDIMPITWKEAIRLDRGLERLNVALGAHNITLRYKNG